MNIINTIQIYIILKTMNILNYQTIIRDSSENIIKLTSGAINRQVRVIIRL